MWTARGGGRGRGVCRARARLAMARSADRTHVGTPAPLFSRAPPLPACARAHPAVRRPRSCLLPPRSYVFHYMVERGVTFLCLADEKQKRRMPFMFLEDVRSRFLQTYGDRAATAIAFAMNAEFARVLQERMVRARERGKA
jgi:hypothetical protein